MGTARILIVEDEIIIAKDLQRKLLARGYDVSEPASSGVEAIQKAAQAMPDLILMDIVLKNGMDGIEVAERLRELHDIPVIYLTAYADERTFQRAKLAEPFGYILKPFDMNLVVINIEVALYRHKTERERQRLLRELQESLTHVKILRGLLPICAWCKKIRDDKGYWREVELYVHEHSEADFTHGICPDCAERNHAKSLEKNS